MVVCCGWYVQHGPVPIPLWCLSVPGCWASFFIQMVLLGFWGPWHQIVTGLPQLITESGSAQMLGLGKVPIRKSEAGTLDIPFKITALRSVSTSTTLLRFSFPFVLLRSVPCPKWIGET
jgi:hypothetical protein